MILSDTDIQARCKDGSLVIEPLDNPDLQIQPASVDLRLGHEFKRFTNFHDPTYPLSLHTEWDEYMVEQYCPDKFVLGPQEFALGTTLERVGLPADLVGRVEGRSSLGRIGLLVHATAGFIDPGFSGHITLEFYNLNPYPLALDTLSRICQISFHQMSSPAARPYGSERGSKYQGQVGVTASRMHGDLPTNER